MTGARKITEGTILTKSTEPLTDIVQVNAVDAEIRSKIAEELAHRICADLARFVTRERPENGEAGSPPGITVRNWD
jgi:hypothetical protein